MGKIYVLRIFKKSMPQRHQSNFVQEKETTDGMKWNRESFIEYEVACKVLSIPNDQIAITLSDYRKMKKIAFDAWKSNMKKRGFSPKGVKLD